MKRNELKNSLKECLIEEYKTSKIISVIKEILLEESSLEQFTNILLKECFYFLRKSYEKFNSTNESTEIQSISKKFTSPVDLFVNFEVDRSDESSEMADAAAVTSTNKRNEPVLDITIYIDYELEPKIYHKLLPNLKSVIRHELEHVVQQLGKNYIWGRVIQTPEEIKKYKEARRSKNLYDYFTDRSEIEAYSTGLYSKAKTIRRPFVEVITEFLEEFKEGNEITNTQMKKIISAWLEYAKKRFSKVNSGV